MRQCRSCGLLKPIDMFYLNKKSSGGRLHKCKECRKRDYGNQLSIRYFGGNRQKALERDDFKCVKCGMSEEEHMKKFNRRITVDHKDNKGRNSPILNNSLPNLQTLCLSCHGKKDNRSKSRKVMAYGR